MNLLGKALWTVASGVIVGVIVQVISGQPAAAAATGGCTCVVTAVASKPF
ncbi:hypothetical protein [Scytonema hofmannii]|jgi:hypothetical protein|nr:hypothetical protein [Scytonema hofmannii]